MNFGEPRNAPESATIEHLHDATLGGVRKQSHRRLAHAICNQTRNAFRLEAERSFRTWIEKRIDHLRAARPDAAIEPTESPRLPGDTKETS